tara:strand:- start:2594 stop:2860 length:267 start_codon:yes stop_codon:yes gene_type:complete
MSQDRLHELLSQRMLEVLRDGRDTLGPDGEVKKIMATAADFNAVRQFLKDNGINSVKSVDSPLNDLVSEMSQRGLKFRGINDLKKKAV